MCRKTQPLMPVIVMTGVPVEDMDARTDAILAEADGFLLKPINITIILALIQRWHKRLAATMTLPLSQEEVEPFENTKRKHVKHVVELFGGNISLAAHGNRDISD